MDSDIIRRNSKEIVNTLALSQTTRLMLAIGLCSKQVIDPLEKQEILEEKLSAVQSADKLVSYIIDRIDRQGEVIWRELESVEALRDVVRMCKRMPNIEKGTHM